MSSLEILHQKRAFSISEAAQYACVSRGTVEYWIAHGLLPYEKLPGTGDKQRFRRIRKKDLDGFLDGILIVEPSRTEKSSGPTATRKVFLLPKTT